MKAAYVDIVGLMLKGKPSQHPFWCRWTSPLWVRFRLWRYLPFYSIAARVYSVYINWMLRHGRPIHNGRSNLLWVAMSAEDWIWWLFYEPPDRLPSPPSTFTPPKGGFLMPYV